VNCLNERWKSIAKEKSELDHIDYTNQTQLRGSHQSPVLPLRLCVFA
jgi:hypothetical protein